MLPLLCSAPAALSNTAGRRATTFLQPPRNRIDALTPLDVVLLDLFRGARILRHDVRGGVRVLRGSSHWAWAREGVERFESSLLHQSGAPMKFGRRRLLE